MDKVEEKEDKRPASVYVCVCIWMCGVCLLLVTSPGPGDRGNKE